MKATRALVLVSNDRVSLGRGSEQVFHALQAEIHSRKLQDEIKVSMIPYACADDTAARPCR